MGITKILTGYHVERIGYHGEVEVLRRSFSSNELLILTMRRLPMILRTSKDAEILAAYLAAQLGRGYYRYDAWRLITSKFAYMVLLPENYAYTNCVLSLPKSTTHYKRIKKLSINGKEMECVKSHRLETRFHTGLNIGLFFNPWENAPCFALYYINPNDKKTVDLELCLDIAPIEKPEQERWSQYYQAVGQHGEKDNLIQHVIQKTYEDFKSPEIKQVREEVASPKALESMLQLMMKNTRSLVKKLRKLGIEIQPGGKHPYKAKNPKTGKTAPIPWRGEFKPHEIKDFCQELQIDYNLLLSDP